MSSAHDRYRAGMSHAINAMLLALMCGEYPPPKEPFSIANGLGVAYDEVAMACRTGGASASPAH